LLIRVTSVVNNQRFGRACAPTAPAGAATRNTADCYASLAIGPQPTDKTEPIFSTGAGKQL
jgi:hypothetical protein